MTRMEIWHSALEFKPIAPDSATGRAPDILRMIKTMLEDKDIFVRRCREGYEFFKSLGQRKVDLAASRAAA
jgi:hypothetical protein